MATLKEYRHKRNFKQTPEPTPATHHHRGKKSKPALIFIVQKHDASHLHFDFRLELNGVLKSWAIPKGPSINPNNKRLAAHVEDHPLDYAAFEGVIPAGHYGGGTVMIWDHGTWEPEGDPEQAYRAGKLVFRLHGKKLHGMWSLVRMKGKAGANGKNWLLIKKMDDAANTKTDVDLDATDGFRLTNARKAKFPDHIHPQLCTLADEPPLGNEWLHEIKLDGYRVISYLRHTQVRLMTRNQLDWTDKFSVIADALKSFPAKNAVLDGELVVLDKKGRSDFQLLQNALTLGDKAPFTYYVFDIVYYQGQDLTKTPLLERKQLLARLFQAWDNNSGIVKYSDHIQGHGESIQQKMCDLGMEGTVSKRIDSGYQQKRSHDWRKIKCLLQQEFIIGGYTDPAGSRKYFGSLLLGYYNDEKQLVYCGHVGTGFTVKTQQKIYALLRNALQKNSPFVNLAAEKNVHWLKPALIAEVKFSPGPMIICCGKLILGLRGDKITKHVKKEVSNLNIKITHPEKTLYQNPDIAKIDIVRYYEKIAPLILPYITYRPLTLLRCPDGSEQKCFFQKHITEALPKSIHTVTIRGEKAPYLFIKDLEGLITLIQMDVLEIHPWGSKVDKPERPDCLIFDLDPATEVPWQNVITAAMSVRKLLTAIGLESFVKTTGGKGLHVTVPVSRHLSWRETTSFTKTIAEVMERASPEQYIAKMSKTKRPGKIFIDYLRNAKGATAIAPYSTRARNSAPIAVPVPWDELSTLSADQFTIKSRLPQIKHDPWHNFFDVSQSITQSVVDKLLSLKASL